MRKRTVSLIFAAAFCLLGVWGVASHLIAQNSASRQTRTLNVMIQELGPRFGNVRARTSSHPKAWIFGSVSSQKERDQLFDAVRSRFDEQETRRIMSQVKIAAPSTTQALIIGRGGAARASVHWSVQLLACERLLDSLD